ncbi:hypothetical protein TPHA_0F00480 [Tetrapisispora phaffii CBS 4417]|uniref:PITH domain-containing protein n=1 Tax=Tetrapisispora phaffii (strain ATCC 24235 / CBS 4417 / NBRC 1672 / NRRL Y-8282 / UCD 70-5) TaxID=1071381 RepID=G8BUV3_TETPH|nr:hypothetical protein TPHA_0F00480 [Tetrapisispora phaffii CBS 4417]CCE63535.1 hypothetical protein TPHA_0F00480 [Tetrapisispora phaffii CBS 4417]
MAHHCEDEHHHSHGDDHVPPAPTYTSQTLANVIDTHKIRCLNVETSSTSQPLVSKFFLKSQDAKFDCKDYIQSDADCQIILHIPFTVNCKIYSIMLRTNANDTDNELSTPKDIRIYKNYPKNIDFDTMGNTKEDYKIQQPENVGILFDEENLVNEDEDTFVEHSLPRRVFQNCHSITLFVENNWSGDGDELTRIYYLEIRGEATSALKTNDGIPLATVYESAPNPLDHGKLESEQTGLNMNF